MKGISISDIWSDIQASMEGDDIILEIRVLEVDLKTQNSFLEFLYKQSYNVKYFFAGVQSNLPSMIENDAFLGESSGEFIIDLGTCELRYYLNSMDEMEFYTNSVIQLNDSEIISLFEFIHKLGEFIQRRIALYIESYPEHNYVFDPQI